MARVRTVTPDGERIRALRLEQGLSVAQLHKRVPCGRATIYRLEAGKPDAGELLIHRLANVLGVKATDLIRQDVAA